MKANSFPPGLGFREGSLIKCKNYASDCAAEPFGDFVIIVTLTMAKNKQQESTYS